MCLQVVLLNLTNMISVVINFLVCARSELLFLKEKEFITAVDRP